MNTVTKLEGIAEFNYVLEEHGYSPMTEQQLRDFGFYDGMNPWDAIEWAKDYISELHTEKCEAANSWRYEQ